ncbi:MAG: 16S rRNA (guanine(966)-N(2))-methyltransferase RsmD [Acidimicrobiia bacterium]
MQRGRPGGARGPRVIAGEQGGLRLVVPKGSRTRPTTDRVKESLFAALGPGRLVGARVLDGYAGSGALAIEALSRGAARATLVDRDPRAVDAIRRNLATTRLTDRANVLRRGVAGHVQGRPPTTPFDLVFLDPPYDLTGAELGRVLDALAVPGWLAADAAVVVERAANAGPPPLPTGWGVTWERVYGDTLVVLVGPDAGREPSRESGAEPGPESSQDADADPA